MAIDFCIKEQWKQVINIAKRTDVRSDFGDPTFGPIIRVLARWEPKPGVAETSPGNFVKTTHWFVSDFEDLDDLGTFIIPQIGDHLWDPGKDPLTDPPRQPKQIDDGVDEEGVTTFFQVRV